MSANTGWLFYRDLYSRGDDSTQISRTMEKVLDARGVDTRLEMTYWFRLETTYPGLLIGSGYTHGISSEEDAKIGFYFDHTTGLPVIPGSSIKGVLRSAFGLPHGKKQDPHAAQKHQMIRQWLGKDDDFNVKKLAREIFEGIDPETGKPVGIYRRDRFYEARVVHVETHLLRDDYLTPHHPDLLKNPVPICFIKVAPGVTFEFAFALTDSNLEISADEKEKLFLKLLQWHGVGAKTNVGYGQFREWSDEEHKQFADKQMRRKRAEEQAGMSEFELLVSWLERHEKLDKSLLKKVKEHTMNL